MHQEDTTKINFPVQILLLTDKKSSLSQLIENTEKFDFSRVVAVKAEEIIDVINDASTSSIVVLDYSDFRGSVEAIIRSVQINCALTSVTMIACVKKQDISLIGPNLNAGYLDYVITPVLEEDLACRLIFARERLFREHMYSKTLERDPQTGVLARQSFMDRARVLYASAVREQISVAIVMVAINKLNQIGQKYGQSIRESILVSFAEVLRHRKRDTDLIGRYDDGVFCLVTVNMRESHLDTYLDDLALACLSLDHNAGYAKLEVNVSIGVTVSLGHNLDDMLKRCTLAVESSQTKGKNQISKYDEMREEAVLSEKSVNFLIS